MYFPATLGFTLLPLALAAKAYVLFHWLLAGISLYGLARVLGITLPAALLAAVGYAFTGLLYINSTCCPNHAGLAAWFPFVLLCSELALRNTS